MKKIYSAPQICEFLVEDSTSIICTSAASVTMFSDGEASDDEDATLSKRIDLSEDDDIEW